MKNIMTRFFKTSLFSSIGLAILGLLLIFQSELTIVSLSYIIGAVLIGLGAIGILNYISFVLTISDNEIPGIIKLSQVNIIIKFYSNCIIDSNLIYYTKECF